MGLTWSWKAQLEKLKKRDFFVDKLKDGKPSLRLPSKNFSKFSIFQTTLTNFMWAHNRFMTHINLIFQEVQEDQAKKKAIKESSDDDQSCLSHPRCKVTTVLIQRYIERPLIIHRPWFHLKFNRNFRKWRSKSEVKIWTLGKTKIRYQTVVHGDVIQPTWSMDLWRMLFAFFRNQF